jgi:N-acetylmuramidase
MISFSGAAERLRAGDIEIAAARIGCEPAAIRAVLAVEARQRGFDDQGRPIILFEPHIFYRLLSAYSTSQLHHAVDHGFAYPQWGTRPYPKDSYPRLAGAIQINQDIALQSISIGLGQILGFNFEKCGYKNVEGMWVDALESETKQLSQLEKFIASEGLALALRERNWARFAKIYNGRDYAKNAYDIHLAHQYQIAKQLENGPNSSVPPHMVVESEPLMSITDIANTVTTISPAVKSASEAAAVAIPVLEMTMPLLKDIATEAVAAVEAAFEKVSHVFHHAVKHSDIKLVTPVSQVAPGTAKEPATAPTPLPPSLPSPTPSPDPAGGPSWVSPPINLN